MRRFFIVGCPRSGTTLLQTLVARHPDVFSFPESHFFHKIRGRLAGWEGSPSWLVSPRAAAKSLDNLRAELGVSDRPPNVPRWWLGRQRYIDAFVRTLNEVADEAGAAAWLEKSPIHLHYISEIGRFVPAARFIHLIRDGRDVVASLVHSSERDPERWIPQLLPRYVGTTSRALLIQAAATRWKSDVERSLQYASDSNHFIMRYESIVQDSPTALARVWRFMSLSDVDAIPRSEQNVRDVVGWRLDLPHMSGVGKPIEDRRGLRFADVFNESEQETVAHLLSAQPTIDIRRP